MEHEILHEISRINMKLAALLEHLGVEQSDDDVSFDEHFNTDIEFGEDDDE